METTDYITFSHAPCPKFRVAIPLLRPWVASDYQDQDQANAVWADRVAALAAALRLEHDQACIDTSRLFYLPRRPKDGPTPDFAILDGAPCEIFDLPSVRGGTHPGSPQRNRSHREKVEPYTDPDTGEVIDLIAWAQRHAGQFEIVAALRARVPDVVLHQVNGGRKHVIRCINEDEHTQAGTDEATIVLNASQSDNVGFVYHCRHGHCDSRDRLVFLRKMLEQRWLLPADLTDERFLSDAQGNAKGHTAVELTEHSVALGFARKYAEKIRYCHTIGAWYIWTGTYWCRNETRLVFTWIRQYVADLNHNAAFRLKVATGKAAFTASVERFAQADEALAVTSAAWNQNPWLLGTPGGTVDLRTGQRRPAKQSDYISRITAVAPSESLSCPVWLAFLMQAAGGDQTLVDLLQRWFGYCLTGITHEHALLFVYGPGGNGKSVLLVTVASVLGEYAATGAMDTFTASHNDRHPTDLAMLNGARMVVTTETEEGRAWAEARIKALTGGDPITARFMRQDFFTFMPAFKLTISGNHKPTLHNVDDAARRRFNVVPFLNKPPEPDSGLVERLRSEWSGILGWMIVGCLAWQKDGPARPKTVLDATADYFAEQDVLTQWIDEHCDCNSSVGDTSSSLFASWRNFALGRAEEPRNAKWFATMLERQGFRRDKDCELFRGRGFRGIRVRLTVFARHWKDRDY